jgi:hypothetical protein
MMMDVVLAFDSFALHILNICSAKTTIPQVFEHVITDSDQKIHRCGIFQKIRMDVSDVSKPFDGLYAESGFHWPVKNE